MIDVMVFCIVWVVMVKCQLIVVVEVDVFIFEMWCMYILQFDVWWVGFGIFCIKVYVFENKKLDVFVWFFESGLSVMDLRGDE